MALLISEMFWKTGKKLTIFYNKIENSPETWGWHWGRLQLLTDIWKCYIWRRMLTKKTFSTDDDFGPSTEEDFNWCLMMMLTDIWKFNIWRHMLTKKSFQHGRRLRSLHLTAHAPLSKGSRHGAQRCESTSKSKHCKTCECCPRDNVCWDVVKCLKFVFAALTLTLNWIRCDETSLKVVPPPPWTIQPRQAVGKPAGLTLPIFEAIKMVSKQKRRRSRVLSGRRLRMCFLHSFHGAVVSILCDVNITTKQWFPFVVADIVMLFEMQ